MGTYRIFVEAVGNHGCQRDIVGNGKTVLGCEQRNCPDCKARELVRQLKRNGEAIKVATLTHWPDQPSQVEDNLLTGERTGSFG